MSESGAGMNETASRTHESMPGMDGSRALPEGIDREIERVVLEVFRVDRPAKRPIDPVRRIVGTALLDSDSSKPDAVSFDPERESVKRPSVSLEPLDAPPEPVDALPERASDPLERDRDPVVPVSGSLESVVLPVLLAQGSFESSRPSVRRALVPSDHGVRSGIRTYETDWPPARH